MNLTARVLCSMLMMSSTLILKAGAGVLFALSPFKHVNKQKGITALNKAYLLPFFFLNLQEL